MSVINPVETGVNLSTTREADGAEATSTDFSEVLHRALAEVDGALNAAEATAQDALVGDAEPHQAMISLTKADLAFRFLVQTRNKAVEAYRELMRLQM